MMNHNHIAFLLVIMLQLHGCTGSQPAQFTVYKLDAFKDVVPPQGTPDGLSVADTLTMFAAPGEYEPIAFAVHANTDVREVRITASDLRSGSARINSSAADIRLVKYWYQKGLGWTGSYLVPELLVHDDSFITPDHSTKRNILHFDGLPQDSDELVPFDIPENEFRHFWLKIHVPPDAVPGVYSNRITISSANGGQHSLPLKLEVLEWKLNDPMKKYGIYYHGCVFDEGVTPHSREGWFSEYKYMSAERYEAEMRDLSERGFYYAGIDCHGTPRSDGSYDFSGLIQSLRIRQKLGMDKEPVWVNVEGLRHLIIQFLNRGPAEEELAEIRKYVRHINECFLSEGFPKPYIYGIDEAHGEKLRKLIPVYKAIKEAGGKVAQACYAPRVSQGRWNEPGFLEIMDDYIELPIICMREGEDPVDYIHRVQYYGGTVLYYNLPQTHWDEYSAYIYRHNYGFWMFHSIADGIAPYVYYQYRTEGSPYNDFDQPENVRYGDLCVVYPAKNGIIPTLLWEAETEGLDDARYLSTLAGLIEEAKSRFGYTEQIRKTEDWLKHSRVPFLWTIPERFMPEHKNFRPLLVYDDDLRERLAGFPDLQDLRWQVVQKIRSLRAWMDAHKEYLKKK